MVFKSFTREYCDKSTVVGFQFVFYCDLCHRGHCSSFVEANKYRRAGKLRKLLYMIKRGFKPFFDKYIRKKPERFDKLSLEWHREHELEFEHAENDAKTYFNRCSKCFHWVCDNDFNIDERICVKCVIEEETNYLKI